MLRRLQERYHTKRKKFYVICASRETFWQSSKECVWIWDAITELANEWVSKSELLHADDLVLMSEKIDGIRNNIRKWKEAFEIKRLKANFGKTKVIFNGGITKVDLSKPSKTDQCEVYSLSVEANSILCV